MGEREPRAGCCIRQEKAEAAEAGACAEINLKAPKLASPDRAPVEAAVLKHLRAGRFREASLAVAAYEAVQPVARGIGVDWRNYEPRGDVAALSAMFDRIPPELAGVSPDALPTLRVVAGMMLLWGCSRPYRRWLSRDFDTGATISGDAAAQRLVHFGGRERQVAEYERVRDLYGVEIPHRWRRSP